MRKSKRAVSFTLLLGMVLMLLAGCGGGSEEKKGDKGNGLADSGLIKAGTGRFMEEEIALPKEVRQIKALQKLSDGSLELIGEADGTGACFLLRSSDNGQKWNKTQIEGLEKDYIPYTAIALDGKAVLLDYMKEGAVKGWITDMAGKTKDFSFSLPDNEKGSKNQVIQAEYDEEGNLVVLDLNGSLYEVAADGNCKKTYDVKGVSVKHFSITGQLLFAVHEEGILVFDTKQKKALEAENVLDSLIKRNRQLVSIDTDRGQPLLMAAGANKDTIMLTWEDGIFHFTRGGSVLEQLADGSQTSLGGGSLILLGMVVMDDKNIFVAANDGEADKLFHYSYDKTAAAAPEKELNVYALDDSSFLRQAVKLFQKNNPDIHVNLEIGLSGDDSVTLEGALSVLNTNILAKKGPDVLILDGMPVDSYIEKGIHENIPLRHGHSEGKNPSVPNPVARTAQQTSLRCMGHPVVCSRSEEIYQPVIRLDVSLVRSCRKNCLAVITLRGKSWSGRTMSGRSGELWRNRQNCASCRRERNLSFSRASVLIPSVLTICMVWAG